MAKKGKLDKDDEEKLAEFIEKQVARVREERGGDEGKEEEEPELKEFVRSSEDEKVQLDMKLNQLPKKKESLLIPTAAVAATAGSSSVFKVPKEKGRKRKEEEEERNGKKKKRSALDEIREEEEARKAAKRVSQTVF